MNFVWLVYFLFSVSLVASEKVVRSLELAREVAQNSIDLGSEQKESKLKILSFQKILENKVEEKDKIDLNDFFASLFKPASKEHTLAQEVQKSNLDDIKKHASESVYTDMIDHKFTVEIIPISVVRQGNINWSYSGLVGSRGLSWDDIKKAEGGNCGYHALRNVLTLVQDEAIINNIFSDKTKKELESDQKYQEMISVWASIIAQDRRSNNISWLDGQNLEKLIQVFAPRLPIILIEHVAQEGFELDEQRLKKIQEFMILDHAKLGFIWNSGLRADVSRMGGTHWVGFVAVKNKQKIVLYYLNSAPGLDPDFKIITKLFTSTPQELQRIIDQKLINLMQNDLQTLKNKLSIFALQGSDDRIYDTYEKCENEEGIWSNSNTKKQIRYKSGLGCQRMQQRYPGTWFIDHGVKDQFIFNPNEMLHDIFRTCLINWKDHRDWPMQIQQEVASLLLQYFQIAKNNPDQIKIFYQDFNEQGLDFILKKLLKVENKHQEIKNAFKKMLDL